MRDKLQYQLKKRLSFIIIGVLCIPLIIIFILIKQSIDVNENYMSYLGEIGEQRIAQYTIEEHISNELLYDVAGIPVYIAHNRLDKLDIVGDLIDNKKFVKVYNTDIYGKSGYLFFNPHKRYGNEIIISYSMIKSTDENRSILFVQELPKAITDKNNLNIVIFVFMLMGGAILIRLVFQFSEIIIAQFLRIMERYSKAAKEKEDMEERLLISEKLASLGRITSGIAHEIGNPLSAILSTTQVIKKYDLDKEKRDYFIDKVHKDAKRIDSLINDLLYFNKNRSVEFELVNINSIIDTALEGIPDNRKPKGISIFKDCSQNLPDVMGDEKRLVIAFSNVILNAIQSIDNEGMVYIRSLRQNSFINIKIKDTGAGISKDKLDKIFDPFFTTKEVGKGFGLGLFICQQIIESHKGKILIQSEEEKGTEFIIKIPI